MSREQQEEIRQRHIASGRERDGAGYVCHPTLEEAIELVRAMRPDKPYMFAAFRLTDIDTILANLEDNES